MTRIRLERIEIAGDLSHARIIGTTDGGTVRVSAEGPTELGLALAIAATAAGPIDLEVPEGAITSAEEIDPENPAG